MILWWYSPARCYPSFQFHLTWNQDFLKVTSPFAAVISHFQHLSSAPKAFHLHRSLPTQIVLWFYFPSLCCPFFLYQKWYTYFCRDLQFQTSLWTPGNSQVTTYAYSKTNNLKSRLRRLPWMPHVYNCKTKPLICHSKLYLTNCLISTNVNLQVFIYWGGVLWCHCLIEMCLFFLQVPLLSNLLMYCRKIGWDFSLFQSKLGRQMVFRQYRCDSFHCFLYGVFLAS